MTIVLAILLLGGLIWGMNGLRKFNPQERYGAVATLSALGLVGLLFSAVWEVLIGVALLVLFILGIVWFFSLLGNASGGKGLKGIGVVICLILALPPFWFISVPLCLCALVGWFVLAPFGLLGSSIKDFMKD